MSWSSERWGRGPRVVVGLHGWGGSRETFAPLWQALGELRPDAPERFSFWSLDLPGHGGSPPLSRWHLEDFLDGLAETFRGIRSQAEDPGALTLVGNCSGAVFAALLALRLETVGTEGALRGGGPEEPGGLRLVMIDAFGYVPWYFRIFLAGELGRRAYRTTFATPWGRSLTNSALASRRTEETHLTRSFEAFADDPEIPLHYLRLLDAVGGVEAFRGLEAPVDLLYGERTFGAVRRSVALWREVLPQLRATELAGAGHLPIQEATEAVARKVFREPSDAAAGPAAPEPSVPEPSAAVPVPSPAAGSGR